MFDEVINTIAIPNFTNLGVVFERDNKYFSVTNLNEVGYEDNQGNYFFAVRGEADNEQESCSVIRVLQSYTFKFISTCSMQLYLFKTLLTVDLVSSANIDNPKYLIKSMNESIIKEGLILNEFTIELRGDVNSCDIDEPCCC